MSETYRKGFFAYPSSPPSIGETIQAAVEHINKAAVVEISTWENLPISGKIVIDEICSAIDTADFFCADLTGLNPNVLFETGYAIGSNKRVWLVMDPSFQDFKTEFQQLRILTTVGYGPYSNSDDIIKEYFKAKPHGDAEQTLYQAIIEPNLEPSDEPSLLYLMSRHNTEASVRISNRVHDSPINPKIIDDPREAQVQALAWYGTQIFNSEAVVCHFSDPRREGARLNNSKHAFVAGIARGMHKPLLMLTEGDFLAPLDYRDLLRQYQRPSQAVEHLAFWLESLEQRWSLRKAKLHDHQEALRQASELKGLHVGEFVAENEGDRLVDNYFVETVAFEEALSGRGAIFVGRKGSGKSANLLALAARLRKDHHNLVCVIKPVDYEFHGIVSLMERYAALDQRGFAVQSLWKFLIYTELAKSAVEWINTRALPAPNDAEKRLIAFMDRNDGLLGQDFAIRLEGAVNRILAKSVAGTGIQDTRLAISEALHDNVLNELRRLLGDVLHQKARVAILMDNLDKAWDKKTDLDQLSHFLLGLLSLSENLTADLRGSGARRQSIHATLAIFLRSDIYYRLIASAGEPDKIAHHRIDWSDPEFLLRVIDDRFATSRAGKRSSEGVWQRYFCETVGGVPIKQYLLSRIMPRPRDLVFLVKAAITTAVNRGHPHVTEEDVREAEVEYSQFAVDSILVENAGQLPRLEDVIYEFLQSPAVLSASEVTTHISQAKVPPDEADLYVENLCKLSFLGVEVGANDYRFADDPEDYRRIEILARKQAKRSSGEIVYKIKEPFWSFLELRGT